MKVPTSTIEHEGNLDLSTKTRLSFDEDSIVHLMSVLTDLYSDPSLAVIREYSCNALDSHIAAGNPDPIRIYLPNRLDSTFRVVDFGVGLSVDEITNLFSKYGWSSKRETDGEVGMLGLGCKSGLTYTSQFTLIAVKNGVKTTVLVTRDTDGVGALQILDTSATDLPTGVEIRIPVKDVYAFNQKATQFFRFWEAGTVLVDDQPPTRIGSEKDALWLDPDVLVTREVSCDYVVMGNVPYPVPSGNAIVSPNSSGYSSHHAVVWVPIGAIDFTPSREALHLTTRTKEVLQEAKTYIKATAARVAQAEVEAATTHWEAFNIARKWVGFLQLKELTYKGEKVPNIRYVNGLVLSWHCPDYETSRYDTARQRTNVDVDDLSRSWVITGHNAQRLTQADKTRLYLYRKENKIPHSRVYVSPERHGGPWMEDATAYVTDWSEIRKVQLAAAKKPEVTWIIGTPQSGTQTYVTAQEARTSGFPDYYIQSLITDIGLAAVPKTLLKSWLKDTPGAIPVREAVENAAKAFVASLTPVKSYAIDNHYSDVFTLAGQIDDPDLAQFASMTRAAATALHTQWRNVVMLCQYFQIPVPTKPNTKTVADAVKRYPLLNANHATQDLAEYVNALYRYRTPTVKD